MSSTSDRYFDVFVEYAKEAPEDILIQITASNRGPEPATLHVLPTLLVPQHLELGTARRKARLRRTERQERRARLVGFA